jgi:hypothetical protein
VWHVVAGDLAATVPHSVGMAYLAELLAHPGREIAAIQLATGHRAEASGVRHPVLDPTARARYRAEIAALQVEIDDADRCADLERAAQARTRLDRLVDELAAVTGLGGRDRCFHDDAERARVSVSKAIRRALAQLTAARPALGRLLAEQVTTGGRCAYRPP